MVVPHIVPFYRRTLAPLMWEMNIPVIPVDHLFSDGNFRKCTMFDGIHLDDKCMSFMQQLVLLCYYLSRAQIDGQTLTHSLTHTAHN